MHDTPETPLDKAVERSAFPGRTDVLVVGAGIAGTTAALAAAQAGADVTLAAQGRLFSGSSFYPGTWGLGLVGPESPEDEADLAATVRSVGCGMADPRLVDALVRGIAPAVAWLEGIGAELKRPDRAGEREFVPCFDHKHRLWRGILRGPCERALGKALQKAGVRILENVELADLTEARRTPAKANPPAGVLRPRRVDGAVLFDRASGALRRLACGAVVLACGGYGGLFERRLTGADVTGAAHAVALRHGARLANMEFLQMMPGLVCPCRGVVFNEKAFRFMEFEDSAAARTLTRRADAEALLDERSGYGPFTSRLAARAVDAAIDAAGPDGLALRCRPAKAARESAGQPGALPEFVRAYYDWLEKDFGVRAEDWVRIAHYAHAANGGVLIDEDASTGVPGLFACGEMTGGVHGADRIGGLSSANGLVFGSIAGRSAARWARGEDASASSAAGDGRPARRGEDEDSGAIARPPFGVRERAGRTPEETAVETARLRAAMQHAMSAHCMVVRDEKGLAQAEEELRAIERSLDGIADALPGIAASLEAVANSSRTERIAPAVPFDDGAADVLRLRSQLTTARCVVAAMRARRESRGPHFRADFPAQDPAFDRPFVVSADGAGLSLEPESWERS